MPIVCGAKSGRSGPITRRRTTKAVTQRMTTTQHCDAVGRPLTPIYATVGVGRCLAILVSPLTRPKVCGRTIRRSPVSDAATITWHGAILLLVVSPTVLQASGNEAVEGGLGLLQPLPVTSGEVDGAGPTIRNCRYRNGRQLARSAAIRSAKHGPKGSLRLCEGGLIAAHLGLPAAITSEV